jgi:hypothetical protein
VREALQKCGIESKPARHKLRRGLGKGGSPHVDGQIHRSTASRALFESAADLAHETDAEVITPLHLVTAINVSVKRGALRGDRSGLRSAPLGSELGHITPLPPDHMDMVDDRPSSDVSAGRAPTPWSGVRHGRQPLEHVGHILLARLPSQYKNK